MELIDRWKGSYRSEAPQVDLCCNILFLSLACPTPPPSLRSPLSPFGTDIPLSGDTVITADRWHVVLQHGDKTPSKNYTRVKLLLYHFLQGTQIRETPPPPKKKKPPNPSHKDEPVAWGKLSLSTIGNCYCQRNSLELGDCRIRLGCVWQFKYPG